MKTLSPFVKSALTLITGTSLSQLISIGSVPILTRIYTPADFGYLGIYMAVVAVLVSFATFQYHNAIIIPKDDKSALSLLYLSVFVGIFLSLLLAIIIGFTFEFFGSWLNLDRNAFWLLFLPISLIIGCFRDSLLVYFNRKKMYRQIAISRVLSSLTVVIVSVVLGFTFRSPFGLLLGFIFGQIVLAAFLILKMLINKEFTKINLHSVKRQGHIFSGFAKYSLPAEALRILGNQIPVFLLNVLLSPTVVGWYNMSNKLLGLPTTVVGGAFTEVFKQRASEYYSNKGNCTYIYGRMLRKMVIISIIPFTTFLFISPQLFEIMLGNEWRVAGIYAQYLMPMFLFKFFSSPLSFMYHLAGKQKEELIISIYIVISTAMILYLTLEHSVEKALLFYSINYCVVYLYIITRGYAFTKEN